MAKKKKIEQIEKAALKGEGTTKHFTQVAYHAEGQEGARRHKKDSAIKINVDFSETMIDELDAFSEEVCTSRQAVIKMMVRRCLDEHYVAKKAK